MSAKENTKTEIVMSENVLLGREHVRFLDDLIASLQKDSGYKATRSQIIRLLIEGGMRRTLKSKGIKNEDELRQMLNAGGGEATRIAKK